MMGQREIIIQDLAIKVQKGEMNLADVPEGFRVEVEAVIDDEA